MANAQNIALRDLAEIRARLFVIVNSMQVIAQVGPKVNTIIADYCTDGVIDPAYRGVKVDELKADLEGIAADLAQYQGYVTGQILPKFDY